MNIKFIVMAHGFEKAGKIEKALKDLGVPYDAEVVTAPVNRPTEGKRKRKKSMDKAAVVAIISTADSHPLWNNETIAKQSGCSRSTVERVMSGMHILQIRGEAPKPVAEVLQ